MELIEFFEDQHVELYNLEDDIGEQVDLARADPEKTQELRDILHGWQSQVDAEFPTPNPDYE